jgi:phage host-nuclease inhibitor protein Gam
MNTVIEPDAPPLPDDRHDPEARPEPSGNSEEFRINSDRAAEWLLRRLGNIEAENARVQAQAAAIVKALESDAESLRFLYAGQLEAYCREKIAQGRGKTVRFLQGTCAFRTCPPGLRISDQGAALHFAIESLPKAVKTVTTLDTAAYREAAQRELQETGVVLPGLEVTPARESFHVKFKPE